MSLLRTDRRACVACAVTVVLSALFSAACSGGGAEADKAARKGELKRREPTRVRVAPVVEREMVRVLQTTTVVESEREIEVFPRASGVVTEVLAEEGDVVEAGAVLAVLDQREALALVEQSRVAVVEAQDAIGRAAILKREAESQIRQTKLAWDQAVRDYERNEKANLISHQALDALRLARDTAAGNHDDAKLALERSTIEAKAAETTLKKAELALDRSDLELSWTRITAPFTGVIARRGVRIGGTVGRGTSVIETAGAAFVLTDPHNLRAVFHRPQRELPLFLQASAALPQRAEDGRESLSAIANPAPPIEIRARAEALPGVEFRGAIQRVSPSIDAQSGSFRVTVRLEPVNLPPVEAGTEPPVGTAVENGAPLLSSAESERRVRLLPGMLVRLEIVTDRHPHALVVPKRSLRREGELNLLFVVREGRARRVEVDEGFSDDDDVEILRREGTALAPGDMVVVVGNRELEDGGEVEVEETLSPVPAARPDTEAPDVPGASSADASSPADASDAKTEKQE